MYIIYIHYNIKVIIFSSKTFRLPFITMDVSHKHSLPTASLLVSGHPVESNQYWKNTDIYIKILT